MLNICPSILFAALPIFINFCARDSISAAHATEEFARIAPDAVNGGYIPMATYLRVPRMGSTMPMNIGARANIYRSFENALNHASF